MSKLIKVESGTPEFDALVEKRYRDYPRLERELTEIKLLVGHAADKFERVTWKLDFVDKSIWEAHEVYALIAELRKAAQ